MPGTTSRITMTFSGSAGTSLLLMAAELQYPQTDKSWIYVSWRGVRHKQEEELCLKFILCLQLSRRWSRCKLIRHDSKRKHDAGRRRAEA
jgi:hypothetical protein